MSHVELSQDVFRPGWILLLAPFALQILCGHVIPPVYVQDLAHSAIKASSCQLVVIAGWLDTDKWNGPHLQRHPEEQRAAEENIRRSRGLGEDGRGLGRVPPEVGMWHQLRLPCFYVGPEQSLPDPVLLERWELLFPVDRKLCRRLGHLARGPQCWRSRIGGRSGSRSRSRASRACSGWSVKKHNKIILLF